MGITFGNVTTLQCPRCNGTTFRLTSTKDINSEQLIRFECVVCEHEIQLTHIGKLYIS